LLNEDFRLRAGIEYVARYPKLMPPECPAASDMGNRLACRPTRDHRSERLRIRQFVTRPGSARDVLEQSSRISRRIGNAGLPQTCDRYSESGACVHCSLSASSRAW
jgi:hypothetical protein